MLIGIIIALLLIGAAELFRLYSLQQSVNDYRVYWQTRSKSEGSDNAITYVALGDSAAQGIGASKPENGYVGLLEHNLGELYKRPVRVINLSVSGAKVQDAIDTQLPQIEKLKLHDSAVVTLDIGSNDMATYDHDRFASQIDYLFGHLPAQTIVADIPYFGGGIARSREPSVLDANKTLERAAKKYGLKVAPLHRITQQKDSLSGYAADFFHPSNKGYKNWLGAFWLALTLPEVQ
jgi:lysophospholipase L1-like esterase